jgi:PAP2 superfamily protein
MKRYLKTLLMAGIISPLLIASCSRNDYTVGGIELDSLSNDAVLEWNEVAYDAFGGTTYKHSLMAARINAMVHIAMHDALNAIYPKYSTYAFTGKDEKADLVAAASSAAHAVLLHEIPAKKGFIDSALQRTLTTIPESEAKTRGVKLGMEAAQAIISDRTNDGSGGNPVVPVMPSMMAGVYQAVPPFDFYFAPYWENVKMFTLQRKDQFRSVAPPALNSGAYATAYNEVKAKGMHNSTTRTEDETTYAKFWYEFSEAGWNRVARVVAINKKMNLFETARLFALVDMAMADAYIAGWDSKLHYNLWRPYTAIRNAATDGNILTLEDVKWQPEMPTPPIQDYPSTHSALGNAAAVVLANILGDATPFTMESPTAVPAGSTRSFTSFSEAAKENADSRVMAGIHFRFACTAGLEMGKHIGDWATSNYLQPLK